MQLFHLFIFSVGAGLTSFTPKVSIVLKALSLSWNLLSGLIVLCVDPSLLSLASLPTFPVSLTGLPVKLAIFCFMVSDTSVLALRTGATRVSIFSSHCSSFFLERSVRGGEEGRVEVVGDMEEEEVEMEGEGEEGEGECSLLREELQEESREVVCIFCDSAKLLYPWIAFS